MGRGARHTIVFTATLCLVFSLLVSSVSVALHDRQEENRRLGRIKNVLAVAGILAVPFLPLALTAFSLHDLLQRLAESLI